MADATIPFKKIPIKHKGKIVYALVDAEDYPVLSRHTWHLTGPKLYPATFLELEDEKRRIVSMHRMILGGVANIDHKSQNVLDARKENLRRATYQQNGWNQPKQATARGKPPSSKYKGVSYSPYKGRDRWVVLIKYVKEGEKKETGKVLRCGYFWNEIEAAKAYNKKIVELRGDRSWVNPIPQEIQHKHPLLAVDLDSGTAFTESGVYQPTQNPGWCTYGKMSICGMGYGHEGECREINAVIKTKTSAD